MKIIERAVMPNGTEIQLEDWREHNSEKCPDLYGFEIGAYPVARRTGKYRLVRERDNFRLSIASNIYSGYTIEQLKADYEALKSGDITLEDLAPHFWNGEKDMFYLGMTVQDNDY